jgi:hypothetical protein
MGEADQNIAASTDLLGVAPLLEAVQSGPSRSKNNGGNSGFRE